MQAGSKATLWVELGRWVLLEKVRAPSAIGHAHLCSSCGYFPPCSMSQPFWIPCAFPNWTLANAVPLTWNVLPSRLPARLICKGHSALTLTPTPLKPLTPYCTLHDPPWSSGPYYSWWKVCLPRRLKGQKPWFLFVVHSTQLHGWCIVSAHVWHRMIEKWLSSSSFLSLIASKSRSSGH